MGRACNGEGIIARGHCGVGRDSYLGGSGGWEEFAGGVAGSARRQSATAKRDRLRVAIRKRGVDRDV